MLIEQPLLSTTTKAAVLCSLSKKVAFSCKFCISSHVEIPSLAFDSLALIY